MSMQPQPTHREKKVKPLPAASRPRRSFGAEGEEVFDPVPGARERQAASDQDEHQNEEERHEEFAHAFDPFVTSSARMRPFKEQKEPLKPMAVTGSAVSVRSVRRARPDRARRSCR